MECEVDWSRLPTLCVSGVLERLCCRDALLASATCRSWRSALGLYAGERESLKLIAHESHYKRNTVLAQIFRKRVKKVIVILQCRGSELEKFVHFILMRFCEARALEGIEFIATTQYLRFEEQSTIETLRNTITTPLLHSQRHSVRRIVLHGCGSLLPVALQDPEESLAYCNLRCLAATSVRRRMALLPVHPFMFSSLQCVALDYNSLDEIAMKALASLPYLRYLALNVYKVNQCQHQHPISWTDLRAFYDLQVEVTLNVINIASSELALLKHYVLTADLPLAVMRVFFCELLDLELVHLVTDQYHGTLREFLYVDAPVQLTSTTSRANFRRTVERNFFMEMPGNFINPFVMMCWRCTKLETLVIHGYCVEAHDLLGMSRLRGSSLRRLEVSALLWNEPDGEYSDMPYPELESPLESRVDQFDPVLDDQMFAECWPSFIAEMNSILLFDWKPWNYDEMHLSLTPKSTKEQRYSYILHETTADNTQTLPDVT